MGTISRKVVVCGLLWSGCRATPQPAPVPIPKASDETQVETAPAESSGPEPSALAASKNTQRVYDEQTQGISARVGERFGVALPGNITTPLKWSLDSASMSDLVTLSAQSYSDAPPPGCTGCLGYPGTAHFVFDAAQEGTTTLRFAYRKLGQTSGQAKRELSIHLTVTP